MSRYWEGSDGDGIPYELWQANVRRALKGKRGQKMLTELRDALHALPERRLIAGALCTMDEPRRYAHAGTWHRGEIAEVHDRNDGEGVCAIGAWLWHKKVQAGTDPEEAFAQLPDMLEEEISETAFLAERQGASFTLAWDLAYRNDYEYRDLTPEQRWQRFVEWIDSQLTVAA